MSIDEELQYFLPQKLFLVSRKYGLGIQDPEKTYTVYLESGSRDKKAPDPGSQIRNTETKASKVMETYRGTPGRTTDQSPGCVSFLSL